MLLFKAAKLVTGLRLLIVTASPIIASSAALLSVRLLLTWSVLAWEA